jgi:hypothetical protein
MLRFSLLMHLPSHRKHPCFRRGDLSTASVGFLDLRLFRFDDCGEHACKPAQV